MYLTLQAARVMIAQLQAVCEYRELYNDATDMLERIDAELLLIPEPTVLDKVRDFIKYHPQRYYTPGGIAEEIGVEYTRVNNVLRYCDASLGLTYEEGRWKNNG